MHLDLFFCWRSNSQNNPDFCKCIHLKLRNWSKKKKKNLYGTETNTSAGSATLVGQIDLPLDSLSLSHTYTHTSQYILSSVSILWQPPERFSAYKSNCHGNVVTIPSRQMSGLHNSISELKRSLFKAILNWVSHTITEAVSRLAVQNYTVICQP